MAYTTQNGSNDNAVSNNEYLNATDGNAVTTLNNSDIWGFDFAQFDASHGASIQNVGTVSQLESALTTLSATGGTINISVGTLIINSTLEVPSNIIIQGAGEGQTTIRTAAEIDAFNIKHKQNIVIRDINIDGDSLGRTGVNMNYVNNILIERCSIQNMLSVSDNRGSGIKTRHTSNFTIRFNTIINNNFDNITCKDFEGTYTSTAQASVEYENEATELDGGSNPLYGVLFTQKGAIHSNTLNGAIRFYGATYSGDSLEFVGNTLQDNSYSSKFPDAQNLIVRHNVYRGISKTPTYGVFLQNQYGYTDRQYSDICITENSFEQHSVAVSATNTGTAFVSNNVYTSITNPINLGSSGNPVLTTCPNSIEAISYSIPVNQSDCESCTFSVILGTATIRLTANNAGPDIATNATVVYNSTSGLSIDTVTPSSGTETHTSSQATIEFGSLLVGETKTVDIILNGAEGTYSTNASISISETDPSLNNNNILLAVII